MKRTVVGKGAKRSSERKKKTKSAIEKIHHTTTQPEYVRKENSNDSLLSLTFYFNIDILKI